MLERFGLGYVWDFAIRGLMFQGMPTHCLAVEVNGGIWQKGGHNTGAGLLRDYEKANHLLAYRGIPTLSIAPEHIADGRAIGWITSVYLRAVNQ